MFHFSAVGLIYQATEVKTGRRIAVKEMQLKPSQKEALTSEMVIMKKARHRCVVEFIEAYLVSEKVWVPPLLALLPLPSARSCHLCKLIRLGLVRSSLNGVVTLFMRRL